VEPTYINIRVQSIGLENGKEIYRAWWD